MCSQEIVLQNPICYEMELSVLDQEPGVLFSAPPQSAQDTQLERPLLCEIVAFHVTTAVNALVLDLLRNITNRMSRVWWPMPLIPTLWRQRQAGLQIQGQHSLQNNQVYLPRGKKIKCIYAYTFIYVGILKLLALLPVKA